MEKAGADVNRGGINWNAVIAASLAGLLFGFDTAVISGVTGALRSEFALSAVGLGTAVSAALIGTLVGAVGAGAPGDRFGSRTVLVWLALGYIVSAIGSGPRSVLGSFVAFRFLVRPTARAPVVLAPV